MNEIITNFGFPIACVIGCAYFIVTKDKANREDNLRREIQGQAREDKLFEQLSKSVEANNKLSQAIDELRETIEKQ